MITIRIEGHPSDEAKKIAARIANAESMSGKVVTIYSTVDVDAVLEKIRLKTGHSMDVAIVVKTT